MPKINKVFGSPILQNLNGKSVLDNFFLNEPKKMPSRKKFYIFRKNEDGQNRKMVTKIEFTPIPNFYYELCCAIPPLTPSFRGWTQATLDLSRRGGAYLTALDLLQVLLMERHIYLTNR